LTGQLRSCIGVRQIRQIRIENWPEPDLAGFPNLAGFPKNGWIPDLPELEPKSSTTLQANNKLALSQYLAEVIVLSNI